MFTTIVFTTVTVVTLFSLFKLTEKTFARRIQYAEKDARIVDHHSRM